MMIIPLMDYEIADLKRMRKQIGLTQSELAKKAGISQSMIAKMESGLLDPSYSKIKRLFSTLDSLRQVNTKKARDVMEKRLVTIDADAGIKHAIDKMKKYSISQLPVMSHGNVVGLVSESDMLDALMGHRAVKKAGDVMEDNPPSVSLNTSVDVVLNLLKFYPLVAVKDKGKLVGIITKSDILNKFY
jgi:predicted transcriptional regulator